MRGIGKRFVYVLRSKADPSCHVGITSDVNQRLEGGQRRCESARLDAARRERSADADVGVVDEDVSDPTVIARLCSECARRTFLDGSRCVSAGIEHAG